MRMQMFYPCISSLKAVVGFSYVVAKQQMMKVNKGEGIKCMSTFVELVEGEARMCVDAAPLLGSFEKSGSLEVEDVDEAVRPSLRRLYIICMSYITLVTAAHFLSISTIPPHYNINE
jgi:hypothetical protein